MATTASHQQPTPGRFFNSINAYEQTEAMKAAVELEIFTAIAEGNTTAATIAKRCEAAEPCRPSHLCPEPSRSTCDWKMDRIAERIRKSCGCRGTCSLWISD